MNNKTMWELIILDAAPPCGESAGAFTAADIDGDGRIEMIIGGAEALLWYRPSTGEQGIIDTGRIAVGLTAEDIDGDGVAEVIASHWVNDAYAVTWHKVTGGKWEHHMLYAGPSGGIHDMVFADIDGDGRRELVAADPYGGFESIYIFKPQDGDIRKPWKKHVLNSGQLLEGTSVADFNGDGKLEVLCGPDLFFQPEEGPFAGPWKRTTAAPGFREMCRTAAVDITGNGTPDIVMAESEYLEGKMSWFENRISEDPDHPWHEHHIDTGLFYTHTLEARRSEGEVRIFLAEMAQGGWSAPYNFEARLIEYRSADGGADWEREILYQGEGTHESMMIDIDGDGIEEVAGKRWGSGEHVPQVHIFKKTDTPSVITEFKHSFIDRQKPYKAQEIFSADVCGGGRRDIFCGPMWYRNPEWLPVRIPGIYQCILAYDIDGDGCDEIVASVGEFPADYPLSSDLVWLKLTDPEKGGWDVFPIGKGAGDWPHGAVLAPILPAGRLALVCAYHSAKKHDHFPEIFEAPDDLKSGQWKKRILTERHFGEQIAAADLTGNGLLDLVMGVKWMENKGDGSFDEHSITGDDFDAARLAVIDMQASGSTDIVMTEENQQWFSEQKSGWGSIIRFEADGDPRKPWRGHTIDKIRMPHSLGAADLDGDGEIELVVAEHDPFKREYHSRCRLFVYKRNDPQMKTWKRWLLDKRFEHHDGCHVFEAEPGRPVIVSHGWKDFRYVHMWSR